MGRAKEEGLLRGYLEGEGKDVAAPPHIFWVICSLTLLSALISSECIVLGRVGVVFLYGELCRQNGKVTPVSVSRSRVKRRMNLE